MLFDVQAALAEILGDAPAEQSDPVSRSAQSAEAAPAKVLPFAPPPSAPQPLRQDVEAFPHGCDQDGWPRTWTGRVVSLDAWRNLSEWDRHGSNGKLFCGICRAWVARETFPTCHSGTGGAA